MNTSSIKTIEGNKYMTDATGRLVPFELIKEQDLLEDQTVNKCIQYAEELSNQIARFKAHSFDDVATFQQILAEKYQVKRGGKKGNVTITSFDGLRKVEVRMNENLVFGPELQIAKALVDECIIEWAEGSNGPIRALIDRAFQVDKEGRINRNDLLKLRTLEINDERWIRAMRAITDSIRVVGTTSYLRFWKRSDAGLPWESVAIDIASVKPDAVKGKPLEQQESDNAE